MGRVFVFARGLSIVKSWSLNAEIKILSVMVGTKCLHEASESGNSSWRCHAEFGCHFGKKEI